ncbi:MAG: dTMP kinase [Deltaproteobacteria bacterium]|nr:dTMP kinase [Deltaproteobacteria bacterium]
MGLFITFEGIEGCGKTTQIDLLKKYFEAKGRDVLSLREPGGTELGEKVRGILLNSSSEPIDAQAELFLYEACRAQLVSRIIRPALSEGKVVISDRFIDSTVAYQGYGRGLDIGSVSLMNAFATGGLIPAVTFLLDCEPEVGLKRAWERIDASTGPREDRFEKENIIFHKKVREGYLSLSRAEPRIRVVNASGEIPSIHGEICDIINKMREFDRKSDIK